MLASQVAPHHISKLPMTDGTRTSSSQRGLGDPKTLRLSLRGCQASLGSTICPLPWCPGPAHVLSWQHSSCWCPRRPSYK